MRDYTGIPYGNLPDATEKDFVPRLRNMLSVIDEWASDVSLAMGRLKRGEDPGGSGGLVAEGPYDKAIIQSAGDTNVVQGFNSEQPIQRWYSRDGVEVASLQDWGKLTVNALSVYDPRDGSSIEMAYDSIDVPQIIVSQLNVNTETNLYTQVILGAGTVMYYANSTYSLSDNGFDYGIPLHDPATGNTAAFDFSAIGNGAVYQLPNVTGTQVLLTQDATAVLATSFNYVMSSSAGGFRDSAVSTKRLRFDLTGIATGGTRTAKWSDVSGTPVMVGNTTAASGVLGSSSLTAQTGSIAAVTMLTGTSSTAGMYRLSFYIKVTTAGTAGTVKATVSWNDGAAQTLDVPFLTTAGVAGTVSLTTLNNIGQGSVVVYAAASQNITYTTTVTGATGSPQYAIYVRIEKL